MFPTLVQDSRRKSRSAGPLVESSIILPKIAPTNAKSPRLQEIAQEKVDEEEFQNSIRLEAMTLAIDAVRSGKSLIHHAANELGIYKSTLTRHVEAALTQGIHLGDVDYLCSTKRFFNYLYIN